MRSVILAAIAVVVSVGPAWAQVSGRASAVGGVAAAPLLTGSVSIDLSRGGIGADICVAGLPVHDDSMAFVLHRGMNVKRVRVGGGGEIGYAAAPEEDGAGVRYAVRAPDPDAVVCVEYVGAFPVYDVAAGDYRASDGSGVIAFNGRTLRARGQTSWYPVPAGQDEQRADERVAYRLRVTCAACAGLYLNGAGHAPGPVAAFESAAPRELVIYAGDYSVHEYDGMLLLGEEVDAETGRAFARHLYDVVHFYEQYLGVPYGAAPDVLRIMPVRYDRPGQLWGFFADPALGLSGLGVAEFVHLLGDDAHPARALVLGVLAHELAHRYFDGMFGGAYAQLFSEPFATFLDLAATRHFTGASAWRARVWTLRDNVLGGPDVPPLDAADAGTLHDDAFRYGYAPLVLVALEERIGVAAMRAVLHALLSAPADERALADYTLLRRSALRAGVHAGAWEAWENECVRPPVSANACLRGIR